MVSLDISQHASGGLKTCARRAHGSSFKPYVVRGWRESESFAVTTLLRFTKLRLASARANGFDVLAPFRNHGLWQGIQLGGVRENFADGRGSAGTLKLWNTKQQSEVFKPGSHRVFPTFARRRYVVTRTSFLTWKLRLQWAVDPGAGTSTVSG